MGGQPFEVKDQRNTGNYIVQDKFLDTRAKFVGVYSLGVYNSLCRHSGTDKRSWPSINKISEELGIGKDSVIKGIKFLEFWKIIVKERVGKRTNNRYFLIDKRYWKPVNDLTIRKFSEVYHTDFTTLSHRLHYSATQSSSSKEAQSKEAQRKEGLPKFFEETPAQRKRSQKLLNQMRRNLKKSGVLKK